MSDSDEPAPSLDYLVECFPQYSRDTIVQIVDSVGASQAIQTLLIFDNDGPARGGTVQADESQFHSEMFRSEVPAVSPVAAPAATPGLHPDGLATWLECSSASAPVSAKRARSAPQDAGLHASIAAFGNRSAPGQQSSGGCASSPGGTGTLAAHAGSHAVPSVNGFNVGSASARSFVDPAQDTIIDAFVPWDAAPSSAAGQPEAAFGPSSSGCVASAAPVSAALHFTGNGAARQGRDMTASVEQSAAVAAGSPGSIPVPIPIPVPLEDAWIDLTDSPVAELWGSRDPTSHSQPPPASTPPLPPPSDRDPASLPGVMAVGHLQAMFPETDADVVLQVLRQCGGSTEEALEALIAMHSEECSLQPGSPPISICDSDSTEVEVRSVVVVILVQLLASCAYDLNHFVYSLLYRPTPSADGKIWAPLS